MITIALELFKKFWPYILAALLVIAAIVWWNSYISSVEDRGYKRGYDKATSEASMEKLKQAEVNRLAFATLISERDAKAKLLTASNDKALKKLGDSQHETARLRNLADSGSVGLHINAVFPTSGLTTQTASNTSVDSGTGAELSASARQDYYALREAINTVEGKLAACQEELKIRQ